MLPFRQVIKNKEIFHWFGYLVFKMQCTVVFPAHLHGTYSHLKCSTQMSSQWSLFWLQKILEYLRVQTLNWLFLLPAPASLEKFDSFKTICMLVIPKFLSGPDYFPDLVD